MFKGFLLILFTFIFFAGCAPKSEKVNTALTINAGFATGGGFSGGAIIYGRGPEGQNFAVPVINTDTSPELALSEGQWRFVVIGWNGNSMLQGSTECNVSDFEVKAGEAVIDLSLGATRCDNNLFSPPAYRNGSDFNLLRIIPCSDTTGVSAGADCDGANKGGIRSFRVSLPGYVNNGVAQQGLTSECVSDLSVTNSRITSPLRIPVGSSFSPFLRTVVIAYQGQNCQGMATSVVFREGAINGTASSFSPIFFPNGLFTEAFVEVPLPPPQFEGYSTTNTFTLNQGTAASGFNPINSGGAPVAYSIAPTLPAGLTLDTTTGVITGTPIGTSAATNYIVTATNSVGADNATISIEILGPRPAITGYTSTAPTYVVGLTAFDNDPTAIGAPTSYAITPALPAGLSFNTTTGRLNGTPTVALSPTTFQVTATGATGTSDPFAINITVNTPALLTTSPGTLNFGAIANGAATDLTLTVTNSGQSLAGSFTKAITTGTHFDFKGGTAPGTGGNCGITLAAGNSCSLVLTYTPTGLGSHNDTLTLTYNNGVSGGINTSISLTGQSVAPALLTISEPATYDFGDFTASGNDTHVFTITNTGSFSATGITSGGTIALPFLYTGGSFASFSTCDGITLAPAATCTVSVTFNSSTINTYSETMTINYNNGAAVVNATKTLTADILAPANIVINGGADLDSAIVPSYPVRPITFLGTWNANTNIPAVSNGTGTVGQYYRVTTAGNTNLGNDYGVVDYAINDIIVYDGTHWLKGAPIPVATISIQNTGASQATGLTGNSTLPYRYEGGSFPGTTGTCTASLNAGASCNIALEIVPIDIENNSTSLTVDYNNGVSNVTSGAINLLAKTGRVLHIAGGEGSNCALFDNRKIKCWGLNSSGQLGYGDMANRGDGANEMGVNLPVVDLGANLKVRQIAGGLGHFCALFTNGQMKCWGKNDFGQLGYGNTNNLGDNGGEMGNLLPFVNIGAGTIQKIATGEDFTCAAIKNGINHPLKCWGRNTYGQLGQGDTVHRGNLPGNIPNNISAIPIPNTQILNLQTGDNFTCVLQTTGARCWGRNADGQLGQESGNAQIGHQAGQISTLPIIDVNGGVITNLQTGTRHVCITKDDNNIRCWGDNTFGQLGQEQTNNQVGRSNNDMGVNLNPSILPGSYTTKVFPIDGNTCAINTINDLYCWGFGFDGVNGNEATTQLGKNVSSMPTTPVDLGTALHAVKLSQSRHSPCAILNDHRVKCWGKNANGELGRGNTTGPIGDGAGEMGDNLPFLELH